MMLLRVIISFLPLSYFMLYADIFALYFCRHFAFGVSYIALHAFPPFPFSPAFLRRFFSFIFRRRVPPDFEVFLLFMFLSFSRFVAFSAFRHVADIVFFPLRLPCFRRTPEIFISYDIFRQSLLCHY